MTELKTLKDMKHWHGEVKAKELKQEAIKRIKDCDCYNKFYDLDKCKACERDIWFNNLTEKDLK